MNTSTLIKALVAGGIVITGVILGENETVRQRLGRGFEIASDIEKAIKNPFGTLAQHMVCDRQEQRGYYDYMIEKSKQEAELQKLRLQNTHDEQMAKIGAYNKEEKKEEVKE